MFHRGFKHEKTDESTRPQAECLYCFRVFETPMKHEARVFEITSPTKKISLNYHLNKVSQFSYYNNKHYLRREMCMMCMILSPNYCAVTIFEYSSTDVTLLPSLFASSERTRCFAKQMAECRFRPPKISQEEENCVDSAIPR